MPLPPAPLAAQAKQRTKAEYWTLLTKIGVGDVSVNCDNWTDTIQTFQDTMQASTTKNPIYRSMNTDADPTSILNELEEDTNEQLSL